MDNIYKYNINDTNNVDYLNINNISPYKEILRYHIITGLNKYFELQIKELDIINYNYNDLIKNNCSKLNELSIRWCWCQYNNNTIKDYVIPYVEDNNYKYSGFIKDINYILNLKDDKIITEESIIIIELKQVISFYLEIEYYIFSTRKDIDLTLNKNIIDNKIHICCEYKNYSYDTCIHVSVYNMIKIKLITHGKKYNLILNCMCNDIDNYLDRYIYCLLFRYSYMDAGNQQLAINEEIKNLFKVYGVEFELFGSAINSISNNYCSLFYDIEKYFGSQDNFFNIEITKGIYWCNPPYDNTIMNKTAKKIVNILENNENVGFLVTIPIWDDYTQKLMNEKTINKIYRNYQKDNNPNTYKDFKIYSILKPYIKDELMIPKNNIYYFNYRKFYNINSVNTYMLIVYKDLSREISINLHNNFNIIQELYNI